MKCSLKKNKKNIYLKYLCYFVNQTNKKYTNGNYAKFVNEDLTYRHII